MNTHMLDHIASERTWEVVRSIELFLGITAVAIVVSFVCLSVA